MNLRLPNSIAARSLFATLMRRLQLRGDMDLTWTEAQHKSALAQAAAWTWRALELGHTAVPLHALDAVFGEEIESNNSGEFVLGDDLTRLQAALRAQGGASILIQRDGCLALPRYYEMEQQLAQLLHALATRRASQDSDLLMVFGGPGTGKTTAVAKLILSAYGRAKIESLSLPRIALAAPTGRAAARMSEAIEKAKQLLRTDQSLDADARALIEQIPNQSQTLHRLLAISPAQGPKFNAENPLLADIVIVDECSMLSLEMFLSVLHALKPDARLILMGDPDQLSAIEPGAVFGVMRYCLFESPRLLDWLSRCVQWRTQGFRFDWESPIGQLSERVRAGDNIGVHALFQQVNEESNAPVNLDGSRPRQVESCSAQALQFLPANSVGFQQLLEGSVQHYTGVMQAPNPKEALRRADAFRLLTVLREGELGSVGINRRLQAQLKPRHVHGDWFHGRLVMVEQNDHAMGLFNGEVGVAWDTPIGMRVYFTGDDDTALREFVPSLLPPHQSAYAMTVHRAQGSEFEHVALILPSHPVAILTRELIYTAITRARKAITIFGDGSVLRAAISTPGLRHSNLAALLRDVSKPSQVD